MKRSKLLLTAGILGTLYLIYLIIYFAGGLVNAASNTEMIAGGLATAIVMPHMVCVGIAVIFNWIAWTLKARWSALVAGFLYAVSMVCMFIYALFVVIQMLLCFVAFAKMKQQQQPPVATGSYLQNSSSEQQE